MPNALTLFPNGRGDEDEALPLSRAADPLPKWLAEECPAPRRWRRWNGCDSSTSAAG